MSDIPQWTDKMTPYQRCEFGMALATMNRLIDNATEYRRTYTSPSLLKAWSCCSSKAWSGCSAAIRISTRPKIMLDKFHHMMVMSLMR